MEITYSYAVEDFEEIAEAADKKNPSLRRRRFPYVLLGIAIALSPLLIIQNGGRLLDIPLAICLTILGIGVIASALQTPRRFARQQYGKMLSLYQEYKAVISHNGIVTISPTVRTELQWAAFSSCIRADNAVALVCEAVMYLFPRRAFTQDQWREFLELIEKKVDVNKSSTETGTAARSIPGI